MPCSYKLATIQSVVRYIIVETWLPWKLLLLMPESEGIAQEQGHYYCMTGKTIWGNIQFESGSIGLSADNTEEAKN